MGTDYGKSLRALVANSLIDGLRDPITDLIRGTAYVYLDYNAPETLSSTNKYYRPPSKDKNHGNDYGKPRQRELNSKGPNKDYWDRGGKGGRRNSDPNFSPGVYKAVNKYGKLNENIYGKD